VLRCRKTFPGMVRGTADPSAALGMTKGRAAISFTSHAGQANSRSLHYAPPDFLWNLVASVFAPVQRGRKSGFAPVGMTILLGRRSYPEKSPDFQTTLSFRPELSWACRPPKVMKNAFCPATALHGSVTLPFVIPSEAEGSAVPRTIPGNVFRQHSARDLRFSLL
jgi:hypothetical protein